MTLFSVIGGKIPMITPTMTHYPERHRQKMNDANSTYKFTSSGGSCGICFHFPDCVVKVYAGVTSGKQKPINCPISIPYWKEGE